MFFLRRTSRAANNAGICDVFYFFRVHPYPKMNQTPFLPQVFDFRSKTLYLQYFVIKKRQGTLFLQFVCNFLPAAHHSIAAKTLVFAMFSVLSFSFQASHKIQEPAPTAKFRSNFNFVSRRPQRVAKLEKLKLPCAICNDRAKAVPRAPLPQAKVDIAKCSIIGRIYDSNDIGHGKTF